MITYLVPFDPGDVSGYTSTHSTEHTRSSSEFSTFYVFGVSTGSENYGNGVGFSSDIFQENNGTVEYYYSVSASTSDYFAAIGDTFFIEETVEAGEGTATYISEIDPPVTFDNGLTDSRSVLNSNSGSGYESTDATGGKTLYNIYTTTGETVHGHIATNIDTGQAAVSGGTSTESGMTEYYSAQEVSYDGTNYIAHVLISASDDYHSGYTHNNFNGEAFTDSSSNGGSGSTEYTTETDAPFATYISQTTVATTRSIAGLVITDTTSTTSVCTGTHITIGAGTNTTVVPTTTFTSVATSISNYTDTASTTYDAIALSEYSYTTVFGTDSYTLSSAATTFVGSGYSLYGTAVVPQIDVELDDWVWLFSPDSIASDYAVSSQEFTNVFASISESTIIYPFINLSGIVTPIVDVSPIRTSDAPTDASTIYNWTNTYSSIDIGVDTTVGTELTSSSDAITVYWNESSSAQNLPMESSTTEYDFSVTTTYAQDYSTSSSSEASSTFFAYSTSTATGANLQLVTVLGNPFLSTWLNSNRGSDTSINMVQALIASDTYSLPVSANALTTYSTSSGTEQYYSSEFTLIAYSEATGATDAYGERVERGEAQVAGAASLVEMNFIGGGQFFTLKPKYPGKGFQAPPFIAAGDDLYPGLSVDQSIRYPEPFYLPVFASYADGGISAPFQLAYVTRFGTNTYTIGSGSFSEADSGSNSSAWSFAWQVASSGETDDGLTILATSASMYSTTNSTTTHTTSITDTSSWSNSVAYLGDPISSVSAGGALITFGPTETLHFGGMPRVSIDSETVFLQGTFRTFDVSGSSVGFIYGDVSTYYSAVIDHSSGLTCISPLSLIDISLDTVAARTNLDGVFVAINLSEHTVPPYTA